MDNSQQVLGLIVEPTTNALISSSINLSQSNKPSVIGNGFMGNFRSSQQKESDENYYRPEGYTKSKAVKQQMDDVLDNLKGLVHHVVQREELKIRQHTNPNLSHAKLKIIKQEMKVKELHEMETKEHLELKNLLGDIRSYNLMVTQLRTKISSLDF
jgi:hypothetical protein